MPRVGGSNDFLAGGGAKFEVTPLDPACGSDSFKQFLKTILFSLYLCDERIRGFFKCYALYKSTFYLLTYFTY